MRQARSAVITMTVLLPALFFQGISAQTCRDENWDSRFFRPGQLSANKVAAANGKIYVAGTFWEMYDTGGGSYSPRLIAGILSPLYRLAAT